MIFHRDEEVVSPASSQLSAWWQSRLARKITAFLGPTLIVAGAALLAFVGAQYGRMALEQHRLAREWQRQNQADMAATTADDGLIKLLVPKIKLEAIVVEGASPKQLLLGPGHMPETPPPGEIGNSVITAHRDTFFRHIYELNKGDIIEVRRRGKLYSYQVTGKKVTNPADLSVLRQGTDQRLTLITCYPTYFIGPAPDRLVVFAKLAESAEVHADLKTPLKKTGAN